MKALRTLLTAIVLLAGAMTMNAQRMSIVAMQNNARFLTDRMAYTLGISDPFVIDEIYRINYDYIWGVNEYLDDVALGYYYDDYMAVVTARDIALRNLLVYTIWNRLYRLHLLPSPHRVRQPWLALLHLRLRPLWHQPLLLPRSTPYRTWLCRRTLLPQNGSKKGQQNGSSSRSRHGSTWWYGSSS